MAVATNNTFDLEHLKNAWEGSDVPKLMEMYADDFEQTEISNVNPPNRPLMRTKQEYADALTVGLGYGARMEIHDLVSGRETAAYGFTCSMPDGFRIVGNAIVELRDGKIVKETTVQAQTS